VKGLDGLIRLAKLRVDEARKALLEVDSRLHEIDAALDDLDRGLAAEQHAAGDPIAAAIYGVYAQAAVGRRRSLAAEREQVEAERSETQEALAEAFQEQKKFEIVSARRADAAEDAAKKREQALLDEVGLQRHEFR